MAPTFAFRINPAWCPAVLPPMLTVPLIATVPAPTGLTTREYALPAPCAIVMLPDDGVAAARSSLVLGVFGPLVLNVRLYVASLKPLGESYVRKSKLPAPEVPTPTI